ncbi:MAG: EF-P lysine aminoacylase EpmA [Bauldia litoralis]
MPSPSPIWSKDRHQDRRPFLLGRNRITAALRRWFAARDFVVVEPAALQVSPGNEAHLHAFATELIGPGGDRQPRYLHTSPEFACKKLLAAGEEKIVAFARVFRNRERGALHAPEFTMLEWYRAGAAWHVVIDDTLALIAEAARAAGSTGFAWQDRAADPFAAAVRVSVVEAFDRFAGIDLAATLGDRDGLAVAAASQGARVATDDSWSDIFSRVLVERVEPCLGLGQPSVLHSYPVSEAALARPQPSDPRFAERFEVYLCGVELANGFGELTDAAEQERRFGLEMDVKSRVYSERYPIDADFIAALSAMPPASGVALGLDRLAMLATGAPGIEFVQWNPVDTGDDR